ncbi:MAG: TRAM domain-containing protein, partial [Granulosicoccus sp.]
MAYTSDINQIEDGMKDKTGWNKYRHKRKSATYEDTELVIESLTNAGDGLGRQDQRVVFVPYTMPGDRVKIKFTQRKKTYALAEVVEMLEPAAERVDARCSYFERCGGCDWQHVPYELQLQAKAQQLQDTLERIGKFTELPLQPIIASDQPYQYRNRIQGEISDGKFHYKWRRSDQRIAISRCEIANESINEWLQSGLSDAPEGRVEIAVIDDHIEVVPVSNDNSTELGFRQVNEHVSKTLTNLLLDIVAESNCT